MTEAPRYRAFLSYAHQDARWALRLQRRLENFRLPQGRARSWPLRPVFLDRSELSSNPNLSDAIDAALANSDALVVVCSPAAAASRWVNAEILSYKRHGGTAIFPIVIGGEPGCGEEGRECFPRALRFELGPDGNLSGQAIEPLAADARKGKDGGDAFLKLVAGLLSVPFDTLKLRQQHRRMRQALTVSGGSFALLVLMSYLAFAALAGQRDAELSRDRAEALVSFMLGDLRSRLEPVGRLEVLDGVGEKALAYFSSYSAAEMTAEATLTRATAMRQIGEVRVAQGRLQEGMLAFRKSLALLESARGGDELVRLYEEGQVNFWLADAHFRDLHIEQAEPYVQRYLDISRELVEKAPQNYAYRAELLYAESNVGTLAYRSGDMVLAREHFNAALANSQALARMRPGVESDTEIAVTASWLGAIEATLGNLTAARGWYAREADVYRSLADGSNGPDMRYMLARALWLQGMTHSQAGDLVSASEVFEESVAISRALVDYDPTNSEWQRNLAWVLALSAWNGYASADLGREAARAVLDRATEVLGRATQDANAESVRVQAAIQLAIAQMDLSEGRAPSARGYCETAKRELAGHASGADRVRILPLYARALWVCAESIHALEGADAARIAAQAGRSALGIAEGDAVELRAYDALLSHLADDEDAERQRAGVMRTEFRGPAMIQVRASEAWWRRPRAESTREEPDRMRGAPEQTG